METEYLTRYIKYAKEKCRPELTEKNREIIKQFYVKLREESKNSGGMNVAVRHIESIIRMSVGKFILIQLMQRCISEVRWTKKMLKLESGVCWNRSSRLRNTVWQERSRRSSVHTWCHDWSKDSFMRYLILSLWI